MFKIQLKRYLKEGDDQRRKWLFNPIHVWGKCKVRVSNPILASSQPRFTLSLSLLIPFSTRPSPLNFSSKFIPTPRKYSFLVIFCFIFHWSKVSFFLTVFKCSVLSSPSNSWFHFCEPNQFFP